ncbi:MAG TPA: hypothetical protein VK149_04195 [Sideroxyarcus sp.]|nr:hypothetical protein [Sideroxyarcus sp.]
MNARTTDPITSHEAGARADMNGSEYWVLHALREAGQMTDGSIELLAAIGDVPWSPQRLRTARSALVKRGLVVHTGEYRKTPSGRRTQVWAAV